MIFPKEIANVQRGIFDPLVSIKDMEFAKYWHHEIQPREEDLLKFQILRYQLAQCWDLAYERCMLGTQIQKG